MRLDPTLVLFVCLLFIYCDVKMNTATRPSVGCRGGSLYVDGCWGFPYLKKLFFKVIPIVGIFSDLIPACTLFFIFDSFHCY